MAINKVIYDNRTLIDLTEDTITASDVPSDVTFHLPTGVKTVGAATEMYIFQDSDGYIQISDTMPDRSALQILSVVPRSGISINALTDSSSNSFVDSNGNQIITMERS